MKNIFLENHKWGGSGIERELFEFILNNFNTNSIIVEIGSGICSTKAFSTFYKNFYSIDDNPDYLNLYENVNYICAPLKYSSDHIWYDIDIVKNKIPEKQDLIFLDGPTGSGNRNGILKHLDILSPDVKIIVHDTYREAESTLANNISKLMNKKIDFYQTSDYWAYLY